MQCKHNFVKFVLFLFSIKFQQKMWFAIFKHNIVSFLTIIIQPTNFESIQSKQIA